MRSPTTFLASSLVVSFMLAGSAFATDYYVDVVNGSDANLGTSPATAWRTITFASGASATGPTTTIHVAPGTYSTASGESFPISFEGQALVGDAGSAVTVIDGGGSGSTLIQMTFIPSGSPMYASLVRGLTFKSAASAVNIYWAWSSLTTSFEDIAITNMSGQGMSANGGGTFSGSGASIHLTLDRARFAQCGTDLYMSATSSTSSLVVSDSSFETSLGDGVVLASGTQLNASFARTRFVHNAGRGVFAQPLNLGRTDAQFSDCLLAHNSKGYSANTNGTPASAHVAITRCTVADNSAIGVENVKGSGTGVVTSDLDTDVVHGNGTDLVVTGLSTNTFNAIGGADPLFVDRANDDYRLRFASPCIDLGNPSTVVGTLDLARVARSIDGDLDTNERADIGCYEFQPLGLVTSGHLSSPLRLEFWGPAGGSAIVYFSRVAPVAPTSTPFGEFDLNPGVFGTLIPSIGVAPNAPVLFQRPIPNNAALIGRTFSFQARTTSALAPQGSAYTNVVKVTIVP